MEEEDILKCGVCQFTTKNISCLHSHLDSHYDGDWYIFCRSTRTAFPRFELVPFGTQTEPMSLAILESTKGGDICLDAAATGCDLLSESQTISESSTDTCREFDSSKYTIKSEEGATECTNNDAESILKATDYNNIMKRLDSCISRLPVSENGRKSKSDEASTIEDQMIVNDADLKDVSQGNCDRQDTSLDNSDRKYIWQDNCAKNNTSQDNSNRKVSSHDNSVWEDRCQDYSDRTDIRQDNSERKDKSQDNCDRKDIIQDNSNRNDTNLDNSDRKDIIQDNCNRNDTNLDNSDRKDIIQDNCNRNDTNLDNSDRKDIIQDNCNRNDTNLDNSDRKDIIQDNCNRNDTNPDNSDRKDIIQDNSNRNNISQDNSNRNDICQDNSDRKDISQDMELDVYQSDSAISQGTSKISDKSVIKGHYCEISKNKKSNSRCNLKEKKKLAGPVNQKEVCSSLSFDELNVSRKRVNTSKSVKPTKALKDKCENNQNNTVKHACRFCGTTFSSKSEIRAHVRYCIKSVSCDICQKRFSEQAKLNVHLRIHSGVRPYICDYCGKTFTYTSTLNKHKKYVHEKVKNFECSLCDWKFPTRQMLERHERRHTKESNFMCNYCGKVFGTKYTLMVHTRGHTGEAPYSCEFCDMSFKHNAQKKKHQENCAGEDLTHYQTTELLNSPH